MPVIVSRFPGRCVLCGGKFFAGDRIFYGGKKQTFHPACAPNQSKSNPEIPTAGDPPSFSNFEAGKLAGDRKRFVIDWSDLQAALRDAYAGKSICKSSENSRRVLVDCVKDDSTWKGFSEAQARDWLENGYEIEGLQIEDFAPPIREKRRFIYAEEGDEIDLSAAWSGEDNYMGEWTKRDVIPGIAMEFRIGFNGSVSAWVVNAYIRWIAQAVFAIESAGIDAEISIDYHARTTYASGRNTMQSRIIRVKKENETVDLTAWSAMLSPAAFRTFAFTAAVLAGDAVGERVTGGIGQSKGENWDCRYDAESGRIVAECDAKAHSFPEEAMTAKLKKAIENLKGNY
jgi:hypothetical protein